MASLIRIKLAVLLIAGFQFSFANLPSLSPGDKSTSSEHFSGLWSSEWYGVQLQEGEKENDYVNINRELVYGGAGRDHLTVMLPESDSTMYIAGYSKSRISGNKETQTKGLYDYWLIKTDADGNKIWENVYGGDHNDKLSSAIITKEGNILLAGSSLSPASGDKSEPSRGDYDYWIVMVDPDGNLLWEKTYGGNRHDVLAEIIELEQGGYLLGGTSNSDASGEKSEGVFKWGGDAFPSDYWVIHIDQEGSVIWDLTIGGNSKEEFKTVIQDHQGNIYISGETWSNYFSGNITGGAQGFSPATLIIKLNISGEILWDKSLNYSADMFGEWIEIGDIVVKMVLTEKGNIECFSQIAELIDDESYIISPLLMRYELTPEGNILNEKFTDPAFMLEDVIINPEGSYYASLSSPSVIPSNYSFTEPMERFGFADYILAKLDNNFNILWQTSFGGEEDDLSTALAVSPNGSVLLGGTSRSGRYPQGYKTTESFGEDDIWILELTEPVDNISGPGIINDWQFGTDLQDSLLIMIPVSRGGYLIGATVENKGTGKDYWVAYLDHNMNLIYERTYGGTGDEILTDIAETDYGGYVLTGYSNSEAFGDRYDRNRKAEDSQGSSDFWVILIDQNGLRMLWEMTVGGDGAEKENYVSSRFGEITIAGSSNSGISGDRTAASYGQFDYWVVNIDEGGWVISDWAYGGNRDDRIAGMCNDPAGGFILSGKSTSDASGVKSEERRGFNDLWVVAVTWDGKVSWERTIGGIKRELGGYVHSLDDGSFIVAGSSISPKGEGKETERIGGFDYWVVKLNQHGNTLNEAVFGTSADDILSDLDFRKRNGVVFLGGYTSGGIEFDKSERNYGGQDYWFICADGDLNKIWDRGIGGDADDYLSEVVALSSRHIFAGGTSRSGAGINKTTSSMGSADLWLVELYDDLMVGDEKNEYVNIHKELVYGGAGKDYLTAVLPEDNNTMYIAGYSKSRISGNKQVQTKGFYDYWLIKTDADGNKLWEKVYGGDHNDKLASAIITSDGNILLAGSSYSSVSGDNSEPSRGDYDYWIVMVDPEGTLLWEKRYGGNRRDELVEIFELKEGGYLLGGTSNSDASGDKSEGIIKWSGDSKTTDYWIIRIDGDGNIIWDRTLGSQKNDEFKTAIQDTNGDIYVAGIKSDWSIWTLFVKLNTDGEPIWQKQINYSLNKFREGYELGDLITKMIPSENGNIMCFSQIMKNLSDNDPYISQPILMRYELSPAGEIQNEKYTGAAFFLEDIIYNPDVGFFASLSWSNLPKFYPRSLSYRFEPLPRYGASDYILAKLDDNFNILWQTTLGGRADDMGTSLAISPNGSLLLGGSSASQLYPGGSKTVDSFGEEDIWILELSEGESLISQSLPSVINENYIESVSKDIAEAFVYPNPATEFIWIILPDENVAELELMDLSGRRYKVHTQLYGSTIKVNISFLPQGVYILHLQSGSTNTSFRIIKK